MLPISPPPPLSPVMASRKGQALIFIRDYLARDIGSPSYGEIAAGIAVSRQHAKRLVRRLVADGRIVRETGAKRGITMAAQVDRAIAELQALGWQVNPSMRTAAQSDGEGDAGVTRNTLTLVPELDHDPVLGTLTGAAAARAWAAQNGRGTHESERPGHDVDTDAGFATDDDSRGEGHAHDRRARARAGRSRAS